MHFGGERVSGDSGENGDMAVEDDDGGARESLDRGPDGPPQDERHKDAGQRRTYAKALGFSSWPAIDTLPEPIQVGSKRRVMIPQRDYELKRQNFRFALIGRVNFRLISLDGLRAEAREKWNLSQGVLMHPLGKCYVIFQFQCEGDKAAVWRRSPFRIGDQVIRFQHWKPDFNIHEKQLLTKLVWIRFPDLPLEYWHENVLLSIAKAVGRPVSLDRRTRQGILGFFARVLVEVDISDLAERVEEVQVERLEPGTSQVYGFCQKVVYEDNVERCGYCKRVGHLISKCRMKRLDDEKQCAADKLAKVPGAVYVEDGVNSGGSNSVRESPSRGRSMPHQQNNFDPIHDQISPNSNSSKVGGDIQIFLNPSNSVSNVLGKESNGDENYGIKEGFVSGTVIELESDSNPINKE
ncbi:uncharacterized protein LOC122094157 [Macadamia integrifolia]|uniref:uncharacterized protein LOC122094157 n=1 Tax=Macadamia integrifolia TaxID=60698 RepID=UPI001C4F19A4|nr:uncharacterized protein LOC122094157 [Macadamia integrifolia]